MQLATLMASIPPPPFDGFEIGPVKIHIYALCIILGGVLAFWLGGKRWAARGGKSEEMYDVYGPSSSGSLAPVSITC